MTCLIAPIFFFFFLINTILHFGKPSYVSANLYEGNPYGLNLETIIIFWGGRIEI